MKSIKDTMVESTVNEAAGKNYRVAFIDFTDRVDIPITVTITVPNALSSDFEKFLEREQDNIFAHAYGGSIEY